MSLSEFPHSEISGSKIVCISPKLIAAYHVFHRLPVPRHSPCALCSLTLIFSSRILHLPTRFICKNCSFYFIKSCFAVFIQFSRYVLPHQLPSSVLVGQSGLEPPTSRLSVVCSSQLSYWPMWWRQRESNP